MHAAKGDIGHATHRAIASRDERGVYVSAEPWLHLDLATSDAGLDARRRDGAPEVLGIGFSI